MEIVFVLRMSSRAGLARCVLALFAFLAIQSDGRAAFMISLNGTVVATDGGVGDLDGRSGTISYAGTVDGYSFEILTSTDPAGAITSTVRAVEAGRTGNVSITIAAAFDGGGFPVTDALASSLSRDLVDGHSTSGMTRLTTTGVSEDGGGTGSTDTISLSPNEAEGMSDGTFRRTSSAYRLVQNLTIDGLGNDKAVLLKAKSERSSLGDGGDVIHNPAPPALVLLLSGAGFLACVGGFRRLRARP